MSFKSTILMLVALMALYAVSAYDSSRMYMHAEEDTESVDSVAFEEGMESTSSFLEKVVANAPKGNPEIVLSSQDHRVYQNLTLPNGLEVLLVSDPTTTKAAASMDIGVGYFQDPEDVAGLAHFLEHMLFLGSAKYPAENAFESYIHTNGGGNNAYTSMEHTNFFFDILPNSLEGALDRFAQFFVSPRLSIDHTSREMQAVNSEHRKNIENDGWRGTEIKRHVASKETPYFKFGTGSVETLGKHTPEVLRGHLQKLWNDYYTAGNMRLVVYGKQDVKTLGEYVAKFFSEVRPTPANAPAHSRVVPYEPRHTTVYDRSLLGSAVYYEPVRRQRTLTLQWAVPSQITKYLSAAGAYISRMLEAEGDGTLRSYLRKQGWVTRFEAGVEVSTQTFSLFTVEMALTPRGMDHTDAIVSTVYQYIAFLREFGVEKWRFDEMAKIAHTNYEWKPLQRPQKYVSSLSASMRWVEQRHWVSARSLFYQWNEGEVRGLLDNLVPEHMVMFLSSKNIARIANVKLDKKELNYGIAYAIQRLHSDRLTKFALYNQYGQRDFLGVAAEDHAIRLPVANAWIVSDAALAIKPYYDLRTGEYRVRVRSKDALHVSPPSILVETSSPAALRVWFKQDAKFKKPKVAVKMRFWTSLGESTPHHAALSLMYSKLVHDSLKDWAYPASVAGYGYSFSVDDSGINLGFSGYADGLPAYIREVVTRIYEDFEPEPARFETLREAALESLANSRFQAPYRYARLLSRHFMADQQSIADLAPALSALTLKEVEAWPKELFSDTRLECLFTGNLYPWQAKNMAEVVVDNVPYESVSERYTPSQRVFPSNLVRRPALDGRYTAYTVALDKHEPNSMVFQVYQAGPASATPEDRLYLGLLDNLLRKPAYNVLRTQEQLGYIVWAFGATTADVNEFIIQVQSSTYEPQYLDMRVQTFLTTYREKLHKMLLANPTLFTSNVKTLYQNKLMNATTLAQETNSLWGAIDGEKYNFMQRFEDAQRVVNTVTIDGLLDYFDRTFGFGKYSGKSLSIQVASHAHHKAHPPTDKVRQVVDKKFAPHTALPNPTGRVTLTTLPAQSANATAGTKPHPFSKKNVVQISKYVQRRSKSLAKKRHAARVAAVKAKAAKRAAAHKAAKAAQPAVVQLNTNTTAAASPRPIARIQAAIDATKAANAVNNTTVVATGANSTVVMSPRAALLSVDEAVIAMLEMDMDVTAAATLEMDVAADADLTATTAIQTDAEDVEGMLRAALAAVPILGVDTTEEAEDATGSVYVHAGSPAASLLEVEMVAVERMDAESAAAAMSELALAIADQNQAEMRAQHLLEQRLEAVKMNVEVESDASLLEVDADASVTAEAETETEAEVEDALEAEDTMQADSEATANQEADEEMQIQMEMDADAEAEGEVETEVDVEEEQSPSSSSVKTVSRLPTNRLETAVANAAKTGRAHTRKSARGKNKEFFHYDGKDTDVNVDLTINRGGQVIKKQLRVSGLAALRREMFMYPLSEPADLPEVITLPSNAPAVTVSQLKQF